MEERRQQRATAVGAEKVVEIWESMNDGYPYFAVFFNRNSKYFQYNRDDMEKARDFLESNLNAIEDAGDNSMYYLNIYSESKANYQNKDMICAFPFRLNNYESPNNSAVGSAAPNLDKIATLLKEANDREMKLAIEIAELRAAQQPADWYDKISGLLEQPGAAQTIVPLLQPVIAGIMGLITRITGHLPQPMPDLKVPAINGVKEPDQDTELDSVLDRLEKHGDLLEMLSVLADFADKNPAAFKMYLQQLKK